MVMLPHHRAPPVPCRSAQTCPARPLGTNIASALQPSCLKRTLRFNSALPHPINVASAPLARATLCWFMTLDVSKDIADGTDFFRVLVRDLDVVLFFQGHHQLNQIQRVSSQILDE